MARVVLLDAGPLGLACSRPGTPRVDQCLAWLLHLEFSVADVVIPAIVDYEVRRELIRLGAKAKLRNLDLLKARFDTLDISAAALERAAAFWALLRHAGVPTAAPKDLDVDCILAGVAATAFDSGDVVTIATTNVAHLGRFPDIDAREWSTIV